LELYALGRALADVLPEDVQHLDYERLLDLKTSDDATRKLWHDVESVLDKYGYVWADRYPRDPAWEINRDAFVSFLVHVAQAPGGSGLSDEHAKQAQYRTEAIRLAARRLSTPLWFPVRWYLFRGILQRAEQLFPHKENRNQDVYESVMIIRRYGLEIGRRLRAARLLQSETDIFLLTWDEIQKMVMYREAPPEQRHQIECRKQAYQGSRSLVRDQRMPSQPDSSGWWDGDPAQGMALKGDPCSPGVAAGAACVVRAFDELKRVNPGDIVVCSHMRPAWSPVLAKAGGMVVETGGILSHGATLAREYGVPTVMNVPGVTRRVSQGDRLVIDGHLGTVLIENVASDPGSQVLHND
jgi:pyruvate,water dikinase